MRRVEGKVAVVTGGAFGIGKACAKRLAEEGAKVAIGDIKTKEGEEVAQEIKNSGGEAKFWKMDTSDEQSVKSSLDEIEQEFGKVDVMVNNAGISGVNKPTHEIEESEWNEVMDINVKGVFFGTKHAVPKMKKAGGGSIINLSSIYGSVGAGDLPPYHASKGAVEIMSKNDAIFYAKENIRVNSVHPGFIWTPMVDDIAKRSGDDVDEFKKHIDSKHPMGHAGEPDDIAYGVVYLASDESKFVTGSELMIDGGYTAR